MARKQDTRAKVSKSTDVKPVGRPRRAPAAAKAAKPRAAAKPKSARAPKDRATTLEAVRAPVAEVAEKGKKKAKKALKAAKAQTRNLVPNVDSGALSGVPAQVGEAFRTIGTQIAGALNTDVGRVMMAEMLIFVAKSLTKAAASTEAGESAKSALLNAGAKIGAAAADAGAKVVETGKSVAEAGSDLVDQGKSAAGAGAEAAGEAGGSAKDMLREVASVAVGAMGGVVADVAGKAIARRRGRPPGSGAAAKAESPVPEPETAADTASPIAADAGHKPQTL